VVTLLTIGFDIKKIYSVSTLHLNAFYGCQNKEKLRLIQQEHTAFYNMGGEWLLRGTRWVV